MPNWLPDETALVRVLLDHFTESSDFCELRSKQFGFAEFQVEDFQI
jgi:hypothetical protein